MDKRQIRKLITEKKKNMTTQEIAACSSDLTEHFCSLKEFQEAKCLFAYLSFNQEVRTDEIIRRAFSQGMRVAVPRVRGDEMEFYYITSVEQDCEPGFKGISEPKDLLASADDREEEAVLLMPGLAFDRSGARVGYGKGLYDRYLTTHTQTHFSRIALCYDFQILDTIEVQPHDIRVEQLISAPGGERIICRQGKE